MSRARFVYREDESRDCESENGVTYDQENYDPQECLYITSEFFEEDQGQAPEENGTEAPRGPCNHPSQTSQRLRNLQSKNVEPEAPSTPLTPLHLIAQNLRQEIVQLQEVTMTMMHHVFPQSYTGDPGQDNTRDRHQDPPERPRLRPTRSTARQGTGAKCMKSVIEQGTGAAVENRPHSTCFGTPPKSSSYAKTSRKEEKIKL